MTSPLVTPAWVEDRLSEVQPVDASWYMPGDPRSGRADFLTAHIPGAVFFDIDAVSDRQSDLPHMLPDPTTFATAAGDLGLRRDKPVVVYDALGLFSAPRVWWTLRVMGYPQVFILDGGLRAWTAEGRPTESGAATPRPVALDAIYNPALVRDVEAVRAALADGSAQVVDARPAPRFRGEAPEPRAGVRAGHMPGALNVPFAPLVDESGRLKSESDLRAAFAVVDLEKPIVTTCGSGVSAAILALALYELGRPDVAVYDGSWTEWGGRQDTEVVTGP